MEVEPQYYSQGYGEEDCVYDLQDYGYDECYEDTTHDTYYAQQEQGCSHVPSKSSGGEMHDGFYHKQWRGYASTPHLHVRCTTVHLDHVPILLMNLGIHPGAASVEAFTTGWDDAPRSPSGSTP